MQTQHPHCDIINAYIIKVPIGQRQRVHREAKCLSRSEGVKCALMETGREGERCTVG